MIPDSPPMIIAVTLGGTLVAAALSRESRAEVRSLERLGLAGEVLAVGSGATERLWNVAGFAQKARIRSELARALPELLERTAWEIRAGSVMLDALRAATRRGSTVLARTLGAALAQVETGVALTDALGAWASRIGTAEAVQVAACLQLAIEAGGPQVVALENLAASLRERLAVTAEARALATQARASAVVITIAPVLFGLVIGFGDSATATFLFSSVPGLACLAAGLVLDGVGAWWMWRITRSVR
ncbi:MAG: type II secretion system F family protein [Acidimicrobiales bacterium]|nr:type II secretion system F family protein [Acidimicrobiales bacterium]